MPRAVRLASIAAIILSPRLLNVGVNDEMRLDPLLDSLLRHPEAVQ